MKHISLRVAWHDNQWNGRNCHKPYANTFCKTLPKIACSNKCNDNALADRLWQDLDFSQLPPCYSENGGFMNPLPDQRIFKHVYQNNGGRHSALRPTSIDFPPFTVTGIPFRYLSKDNQDFMERILPDIHEDVTPTFNTAWIYGDERQREILSWFRNEIHDRESLCVFYCKNGNPIDDEGKRLIVGIGEVTKLHPLYQYDTTASYSYPLWEIIFEHSIRPSLSESKGFLLPYHDYLKLEDSYIQTKTGLSKEEALREIKVSIDTFKNSSQIFDELSYVCDHVSDQSMLIILLAARQAIETVIRHGLIGGDWENQLKWIDSKIGEIKAKMGPFPGFAEALRAIGFDYAYLIEEDIRKMGCGIKENPWIYLDKLLLGNIPIPQVAYNKNFKAYREYWVSLPKQFKHFLELMSRFDISSEKIELYLNRKDWHDKIISNPYILSEDCIKQHDYSIPFSVIDFGVMVDQEIQGTNIPSPPSAIEIPFDERRLRAILVEYLWSMAEEQGHTSVSIEEAEGYLKNILQEEDNTRLPLNVILTKRSFFSSEIAYIPDIEPKEIQLKEFFQIETKLESIFLKRMKREVKDPANEDWGEVIMKSKFYNPQSEVSQQAARQQEFALQIMDRKRLSLLTGGAGTGKTAVVSFFLSSQTILNEGVLLLAPTGKARVRLREQCSNDKRIQALTVAQFLMSHGRYDGGKMQPVSNHSADQYSDARNIIIDECSMLSERDLYVLFEALDMTRIKRIILIGDPSQLPPIGPGRPFADLYNLIRFNSDNLRHSYLKDSLAQLHTVVRTVNGEASDILSLASWFSFEKPTKDADTIFDKIESKSLSKDLEVDVWSNPEVLLVKLQEYLCKVLNCDLNNLGSAFKRYLGTDQHLNLKSNGNSLENLQILTPVRNNPWGVYLLNKTFQKWIHSGASPSFVQISNQIVYEGDKVMQFMNEKRIGFPSKEKIQLSNGQIGFVDSIIEKGTQKYCNVNFNGIPYQTFGYMPMKSDDSDAPIELAYAISIHKSQGSDFNTVILILPKSGRNISRELIYTALTRAKKRMIVLMEENVNWLYGKSKPESSILALRQTNLFKYSPDPEIKENRYRTEGLIHRTKPDHNNRIISVRSKSEVIIANEIISAGIDFKYEEPLMVGNGKFLLPDFTFVDDSGEIIIWEHLGMLAVPSYRAAWERKLEIYHSEGFEEGENLFITKDCPDGSFNSQEVMKVLDEIKKIMI